MRDASLPIGFLSPYSDFTSVKQALLGHENLQIQDGPGSIIGQLPTKAPLKFMPYVLPLFGGKKNDGFQRYFSRGIPIL